MLLFIKYRRIIMVGIWYYNQSGATELLIMSDFHYGRMCFKSVETFGALHYVKYNAPQTLSYTETQLLQCSPAHVLASNPDYYHKSVQRELCNDYFNP